MRLLPLFMAGFACVAAVALYFQGVLAALGWVAAAVCLAKVLVQKREVRRARRLVRQAGGAAEPPRDVAAARAADPANMAG